jgi:DNA mismatch repair ATPase MutS
MAGKSSFLRTLGINLRLAYVGGSVAANSLQTSLFRLYTSIHIQDSLADGFSFFYAEVRRLQSLLAALQQDDERPLLFLIDEIFRGTNNRERLIGSRAYIRALASGHGLGLVATHDLELVQLADELSGLKNYHFRDAVENGRMIFDYKLHKGPCPTTNALKIMQLAGLPVAETLD